MNPPEKQRPRSIKHFTRCREQRTSNHDLAGFWLATLKTAECNSEINDQQQCLEITKCPAEYVVGLYSTFAEKFDELLVNKLDYKTPAMLRRLLDTVDNGNGQGQKAPRKKWHTGVDLGCGTGLSGMAFRDIIEKMIGVDLSGEMLLRAKQRCIYEDLILGDVSSAFINDGTVYDIVFACDVFVYIGDLTEVFDAVSKSLHTAGLFCFSTESLEDDPAQYPRPFMLHSCARFAHKQSYIEHLAQDYGFEILRLQVAPIRKNQGKPVKGMLVILRMK